MLRAPCEELVRYVLPALRGALVTFMYAEKRMRQVDIARLVGISQSAVSRYINMERGLYRRMVDELPEMRSLLEGAVAKLEKGENLSICDLCREMRDRGLLDRAMEIVRGGKLGGAALSQKFGC
ncbi:MAG: hypothetical protein QXP94_04495 [Thermofilaceae archaeon]